MRRSALDDAHGSYIMSVYLPPPITLYLSAANRNAAESAKDFFAMDAIVRDEGKTFHETSHGVGPAFQRIDVGRGAAIGDLDNDGAVDILVTNNNGAVRLLRNEIGSRQHWLQVRLEGVRSNRFGIGARVAVVRDGEAPLWRRVHTDSSYLSASDVRVHFGLGRNPDVRSVIVHWPDGSKESWDNMEADTVVVLRQGSGKPR